ncbi:MAG: hypothetical protein A2086_11600 [Spirochaetes bacterium GWD1_27_9]|nr:MAG: hypothetical protein A2Y34_12350 [Spirochaetes bacterium GWC1_27_15]OHD38080.1 MAG: hypothetical protein A2086_11600 [Spirochaetes bacterium GWD1_27_9]
MNYSMIEDISILNSYIKTKEDIKKYYEEGLFSSSQKFENFSFIKEISTAVVNINPQLKKRMSQMSLGVFYVIEEGPGKNLANNEEIYLFSGFAEIDTTDKIIKNIVIDDMELVSPTLFHNSVHNTPLGYYTIIKKKHNYCTTISDGLATNLSFINYIKNKVLIDEKFVVITGEETSPFFELDQSVKLNIVSSFISYRITPFCEKGFKFVGIFDNLEEIINSSMFFDSKSLFVDKKYFYELKNKTDKKIYTEYPLKQDNPSGIIFRLALPFYLDILGNSLIIEEIEGKFYLFEVKL